MTPLAHHEFMRIHHLRPAPGARFSQPRRGLRHIEPGQRRRHLGQPRRLRQRAIEQMRKNRPLPRRRPFPRFAYPPIQLRQLRMRKPRPVRHSLPQYEFRVVAQLLDRHGRRLDHIAELLVMFDLEASHTVFLSEIELHCRNHAPAVIT